MGFLLGLPAPRVRYAFASCPYSIRRRPISWAARDGVTSLDLALYLVTDRQATRGRTLEHVVEAALRGGVSIVQLREKQASTREMVSIGNKLRALTRQFGVPLLVNDRIDVAQAIAADGVHLGQDDMPADLARRILGPEAIIGVSAGNIEEAKLAMECGAADYLGVGPVYLTKTKSDAGDAIGMMGLSQVIRTSLSWRLEGLRQRQRTNVTWPELLG